MRTPRRDFLGWLGASTVLTATGVPRLSRDGDHDRLTPVDTTFDMTWTDKVQGKVRAVFDSPDVSEGAGLFRACLWRTQHKQIYGTERNDASAVLVLRHLAIPLIMDDAYWQRFEIGKHVKLKDPSTNKWVTGNPIRTTPAGMPPQFADYNLLQFLAQGGIVLGCNLAFREVVSTFAKADKSSHEEAEAKARAQIIPGVILQPSGIFAALRAQEVGCNYILAS